LPLTLPTEFPRIARLPPYVFNITSELKLAARQAVRDIKEMFQRNG
jgi:alanine-synthesizing transaminase